MNYQQHIEEIKKTLAASKSVFVLLPHNPSFDATAAALALFLSLKENGKNVLVGSPTKMRVEFKSLVGLDRISDKIGNRNLIVSFDYAEDSIEKVSYNVEEGKFNLVIEPKSGFPPLERKGVKFSYEGIEANLIFVIGAKKIEDLGVLYEKDRQAFNQATVVNIDRTAANTKFGQINVVDQGAASISEVVFRIVKKLNLHLDVDIAGNLLKGIETQTQNLQAPFVGPDAFEAVADLMRSGAKRSLTREPQVKRWTPGAGAPQLPRSGAPLRGYIPPQPQQVTPQSPPPTPNQLTEPRLKLSKDESLPPTPGKQTVQQQPKGQDPDSVRPSSPSSPPFPQPGQGQMKNTHEPKRQNNKQPRQNQAEKDWMKPKIYKGSTKV